jgi:hypothetical protein
MEFKNEAQEVCYQQVNQWMHEIFGEQMMTSDKQPMFAIVRGSALVQVGVHPWQDANAIVSVFSYVVVGAQQTPQLLQFLLTENNKMLFGAFSLDQDGDIAFEHTIVGSTIQKEELRASVFAVSYIADEYDDIIVSRFGGLRAADRD